MGNAGENAGNVFFRRLHGQLHSALSREQPFQIFRGVAGHQLPFGQNQDSGADLLHLRQNVTGKNDGVLLPQLADQLPYLRNLPGVKPHGRLVQNDDLRVAQHRLRNAHPLAVAFGQILHQPVGNIQCAGDGHDPVQLPGNALLWDALCPRHEAQIFPGRSVQIQRRLLGQIPDEPFGLSGVLKNVIAADDHLAGGRGKTARHNVHGRGFSGAVRPKKAVDLPLLHGEGQVGHGSMTAVALGQMLYFNQRGSSFY